MSEKRKSSSTEAGPSSHKRQKRPGFQVGPANLPDGIYKRKTQKIKQNLIDKAKIRKEYAKLKKTGAVSEEAESIPQPASLAINQAQDESEEPAEPAAPHPDRQDLMDKSPEPEPTEPAPRRRKPKAVPFKKEYEQAQKRKAEAEERRKARELAEQERQQKIFERERFRKAMAKARTGGPNGQRKLGRESTVLLEKVRRMVGS